MRKVFIKGEQKRNRKKYLRGGGAFRTLRFGSGPPDGANTDGQQDQERWHWAAHGSSVSSRQPEEQTFTTTLLYEPLLHTLHTWPPCCVLHCALHTDVSWETLPMVPC